MPAIAIATIVRIILHRITGIFPYDRLNIYRDHPRDDYLKASLIIEDNVQQRPRTSQLKLTKGMRTSKTISFPRLITIKLCLGVRCWRGRGNEETSHRFSQKMNFQTSQGDIAYAKKLSNKSNEDVKSSRRQKRFGQYLLDLPIQKALHYKF